MAVTLDHILNGALQRETSAILLLNEVHVPIAGRGDLVESDIQSISRLLSWTEVGSTGQIPYENNRRLHFHHAESHTLVLIQNAPRTDSPALVSPSTTVRDNGSPSAISTSLDTVKGKINLTNES